jgi:6-phosphogluconolactonase
MVKLISIKERAMLEQFTADLFVQKIQGLLQKQKQINIAICGGRSVSGIFSALKNKRIQWKKIHIFMVDERLVPITDRESNYKLARDSFIDELIQKKMLLEENMHPFIYTPNTPDLGIQAYAELLERQGGIFDIALISSGEDGHIGALYPKHHSIKDKSEFFIAMHDSPKPPKDRMSMSKALFLKSKIVIALFLGDEKKAALEKCRTSTTKYDDCPVKLIEEIADGYIITDIEFKSYPHSQ